MVLSTAEWWELLGSFLRILVLLVVVGFVVPRLAVMVADMLALPGLDENPELQLGERVRRVTGLYRISKLAFVEELERRFLDYSVQLRCYYYGWSTD